MRSNVVGYRYWLPMLPVLAAGIGGSAYGLLVGVNGAFDRAEPYVALEAVYDRVRQPRDGTFDHRLRTAAGAFDVTPTLFEQADVGSSLSVVTHPGRLGVPWRHPGHDLRVVRNR